MCRSAFHIILSWSERVYKRKVGTSLHVSHIPSPCLQTGNGQSYEGIATARRNDTGYEIIVCPKVLFGKPTHKALKLH